MMTDPIADMLTRIRNASMIKKPEVVLPYSKIKKGIADILLKNGYLAKVEEKKDVHPYLVLTLQYHNSSPAVTGLKRVSKPGHRVYVKSEDIKTVLNGFGIAILSTPKGLLTNADARKAKVGGEVICEVY